MKDTNQSATETEETCVEESTRGFPVVTEEQDGGNDVLFEMEKRNGTGDWESAAPVSVTEPQNERNEPEQDTAEIVPAGDADMPAVESAESEGAPPSGENAEELPETPAAEDDAGQEAGEPDAPEQEAESAAEAAIAAEAAEAGSAEEQNREDAPEAGAPEQPAEEAGEPAEEAGEAAEEAGAPAEEAGEAAEEAELPAEDEGGQETPRFGGKRIAAIIAGVAVIAVAAFSAFVYLYPNIFPGVCVADHYKLGGMSQEEAQQYIAGDVFAGLSSETLYLSGTDLLENEEKYYAFPVSELAESVDSSTAAQQAYLIGREGNYFQRVGTVLNSMFTGWEVALHTQLIDGSVEAHLDSLAADLTYNPVQPSWSIDKESETMTIDTGRQGVGFDKEAVSGALSAQLSTAELEPYTIETYLIDQNKPDPEEIAEESSTEPVNATVDKTDGTTIIDSVDGIQIDPSSIATAIGDATEQTYTLPVEYTPATITAEDLSQVLFRDVLASSTTYYNSGQTGRTTNLKLATEAINGTILNPGEEFSYNSVVGERTAARGYQTAIIFTDGQQVNDYGGGVCQPSSTAYMAVLRADLEVTERWCHQFQITYTPISQDAAVAWGSKDFRFKNNTDYPIKIVASASGGSLNVQIIGTKTVDKTVTFSTSTSYGSSYKYASLYKTVTVNGESTTVQENESTYLYG